jgi:Flp pilus assembly pilin Flp
VFEFCPILLRARVPALDRRLGQRGASSVEYGLLIAGIAVAMLAVVPHMGHVISTVFHKACSKDAGTGGSC